MYILIFSTVFYPVLGGIENLTLNLSNEFVKKGHKVKVITSQKQTKPLPDIEVYYAPDFIKTLQLFLWSDVYYMPNISLKGVWPLIINPRKRWVISQNDFSLTGRKNFLSLVKLLLIKLATKNIAVSRSIADSLRTPSEIIYNCYDDAVFNLQNSAKRTNDFVFVGRLVSQKGCDTLIRACHNLQHPFTLTIVGDGPEMDKLKGLTEQLNLTKSVHFAGCLNSAAVAAILNQHKVLVVPSVRKEGFGIVVLEGLACGCKIIAADTGGLPEAVSSFGTLFQPGDVQQLNALLAQALTNVNQPVHQQEELTEYLGNFKKDAVAQKYLSTFTGKAKQFRPLPKSPNGLKG